MEVLYDDSMAEYVYHCEYCSEGHLKYELLINVRMALRQTTLTDIYIYVQYIGSQFCKHHIYPINRGAATDQAFLAARTRLTDAELVIHGVSFTYIWKYLEVD